MVKWGKAEVYEKGTVQIGIWYFKKFLSLWDRGKSLKPVANSSLLSTKPAAALSQPLFTVSANNRCTFIADCSIVQSGLFLPLMQYFWTIFTKTPSMEAAEKFRLFHFEGRQIVQLYNIWLQHQNWYPKLNMFLPALCEFCFYPFLCKTGYKV